MLCAQLTDRIIGWHQHIHTGILGLHAFDQFYRAGDNFQAHRNIKGRMAPTSGSVLTAMATG